MFFGCFIKGVLFGGDHFVPITHYLLVYGCIYDHDYKSTLFWLKFWAKGKAMGVKRVFFERP